jgi:putative membrane protein
MRYILGILLLVFLGAVAVFAAQNNQTITIHFVNWEQTTTLAFLTVAVYVLGMLSGWNVVTFLRGSINRVTAPTSTSRDIL